MMKFRENEDAVSPVIGVILMVAITVILAAVIAAFVFGMGSSVQTQKTVGLSLQKDQTALQVTVLGGPDLPTLQWLKVTIGDTDIRYTGETGMSIEASGANYPKDRKDGFKVGEVFKTADGMTATGYKHVIVVGHFSDGQDQLLLDKQL